jgi:DNA invertase Pin-like site-specific DNA recombinase
MSAQMQGSRSATAYSYSRFSSPVQAEGDSMRRQIDLRDSWLKKSGAVLDTKLTLHDKGVSAFAGKHRENPDRHALAAFLELVRKGQIERGSFLIVESLDRLTREHIRPALTLLLNLIESGIRVVQLMPTEAVYDEQVEPMALMMAIMELSRGHSESRMKSERVGRAWREKKKQAASGVPLTSALPAWLKMEGGRITINTKKAEVIRRIFRLATSGYGIGSIAKLLNAESIPPIARAEHWARSYVAKILANRSVFGEYQPHRGHAGPNRKPEGPPIPNYFPAVVTEDVWHAAQKAMADRKNRGGRPSPRVGLFSGLLKDARDGGTIVVVNKGGKTHGPSLVSYRATQGIKGAKYVSFPLSTFEKAILSELKEIKPSDILPRQDDSTYRVEALAGKIGNLESRIEKIKAQLLDGDDIASVVSVLKTLEHEKKLAADELAIARQEESSPLSEAWGECKSLLNAITKAKDPQEARTRLRAAIRRITKEVRCLFLEVKSLRLAAVQFWFDGGAQRGYVIAHLPGHGSASGVHQPPQWWVKSIVEQAKKDTLDLRKKEDVTALERALSTTDPKQFEGTPEFRKEQVRKLRAKKMTLAAIAEKLGVTTSTVNRDIQGRKPRT